MSGRPIHGREGRVPSGTAEFVRDDVGDPGFARDTIQLCKLPHPFDSRFGDVDRGDGKSLARKPDVVATLTVRETQHSYFHVEVSGDADQTSP